MPTDRAMKAAEAVDKYLFDTPGKLAGYYEKLADLIDREAGIAELERQIQAFEGVQSYNEMQAERDALAARVKELERDLKRVEISHDEVNKMHDAIAKRLAAVIAYCDRDIWPVNTGILLRELVRLARGEE